MNFPTEYDFQSWVRNAVMAHLRLQTNWIGDPTTSTFGIAIDLTWDGNPFASTIVDFIGKTN